MTMTRTRLLLTILLALLAGNGLALAQYHVYWGDVHGHTALSDGKGTLDDYFTHARDAARLDFAIVSDHDFGHAPPWRMSKTNWRLIHDKAEQYSQDGRFAAIAGYEWTSQPKYWTAAERLFDGPPMYFNHKNVYYPGPAGELFSAKDPRYRTPGQLAEAVLRQGGLIQNNHPDPGLDGRDQFDYDPSLAAVIANSEICPDVLRYNGKTYQIGREKTLREFLNRGGKTGFVCGSDTHEGKPAARTAVLARALTRPAIFEALRHRRNYAVSNARIVIDFNINGHPMGEEIEIADKPRLAVKVEGTDRIDEVALIRDGVVLHRLAPAARRAAFEYLDRSFTGNSYYYVRAIQADRDEHGNRSHAWSSPIWVKKKK